MIFSLFKKELRANTNHCNMVNNITGKITNIKYTPYLCSDLPDVEFNSLETALANSSAFLLDIDGKNKAAISWWVSAKRTRSYPYARVYNTLSFSGKRITIIPIFKDEGLDGDRDFLQFDTVALMSLLNVHVIIAYYVKATKSQGYRNKITEQRFDIEYIKNKILEINSGQQSDALHWNMNELSLVKDIGNRAIESYRNIGKSLNVTMSNYSRAVARINEISESRDAFLNSSRRHASFAQQRECVTMQPKESVDGTKGKITIKNYLGGEYYFTVDETSLLDGILNLIEAKHCNKVYRLPAKDDIKDALIKMILYTNLEEVKCNDVEVKTLPSIKLTNANNNFSLLNAREKELYRLLSQEAKMNGFQIL